jgi:hypothetical protein
MRDEEYLHYLRLRLDEAYESAPREAVKLSSKNRL